MADQVLDAKGLNCPLPILKAKKALKAPPAMNWLNTVKKAGFTSSCCARRLKTVYPPARPAKLSAGFFVLLYIKKASAGRR